MFGGSNAGSATQAAADVLKVIAAQYAFEAQKSAIVAGNNRRWDEWKLQENLANIELKQIDKQLAAAEIRLQIAEKELQNHEQQIAHAQEIDEFMRGKFSNQELYDWMVSQVSAVYFQCYQLAFKTAQLAEASYRFERGVTDTLIRPGQWDSLRRGLMAGEQLQLDLRRLEMKYLQENTREFELTKHISLVSLNPLALIQLKETGSCEIHLPEVLFDLDYPGHYFRRIKSVSLTIPCVTGSYTSVNCTLTLLSNEIRIKNTVVGDNYVKATDDDRFSSQYSASTNTIATSTGQNDNGLFELNFRDERYLPFEGAGAISTWKIELSGKWRTPGDPVKMINLAPFDFSTVIDVIFHIRYTSRFGEVALKDAVLKNLTTEVNALKQVGQCDPHLKIINQGLLRLFSLRHEFPGEWHQFLNPTSSGNNNTMVWQLTQLRFPYLFHSQKLVLKAIDIVIKVKPDFAETHNKSNLKLKLTAGETSIFENHELDDWPTATPPFPGLLHAKKTFSDNGTTPIGCWSISAWLNNSDVISRLDPNSLEDFMIIYQYSI